MSECKTRVIKYSSRVSTKIKDNYYTFDYGEERTVLEDENVDKEIKNLIDDCNAVVDSQVEEVYNLLVRKK